MKTTKLLALFAVGAFSLGTVQQSSAAFANGDLLLSFQATGGEGVTSTIVANLGKGYSYRNATSNISNVINIGASLSSVFGTNWYDRTDLYFNIIGNQAAGYSPANQGGPVVNGDARNAIYVSRARTDSDATSYTAWSSAASAMNSVGTQAQSYNSAVSSLLSSDNVATIQTSALNTIEEFTTPAGSLLLNFSNFAADFNQAFASGSLFNVSGTDYEGALTLQRINRVDGTTGVLAGNYVEPGIAAGTGSNEGFFAISSTGQVNYFAPVASVIAPVITSATSQNGQVGTSFSYQIAASNNPTSFGATGLPAGLSVNATTGLISGTPTTAGNSTVTINATNSAGTGNATLTISILAAPPAITSATSQNGQVGVAFNYQIAASNNPTSFGASGLPAGLSVNATTGLISGTPTTAGNSTATVNATNSGGTGNATLTISILPAAPAITSATSASGQVGATFSYQITASNNPTSFDASGLPAGLSVNATTGLISGTPTTTGSATITVIATNSSGTGNATLILSITSEPVSAPVIGSAASQGGQVGTAFSYQIAASNNPTSFGASGLPAGLSVNATTGLISGTPTVDGDSTATINATNSGGTGNATLTISILPAAPAITSNVSASGQVGTAFSYQIAASNNPTSFGASGLPAGMSMNATTGLISGTPTTAGNSTVTVNATNTGGTGNATLTISILPAAPAITSNASASGQVGIAFSYQIAASNNPSSFGSSGLPAGLSVNATTGLISGTPTVDGDSTATINATNTGGTGNATLTISILPAAPAITSNVSASGQVGTAFSYQIAASNNPTSFGASGLPTGLSVNATTGLISGTPTTAGNSTATINATNSGGTGNATLSISIVAAPVSAPVISSAASQNGQVGTAFSYQIAASNNPTSFGASGLPAGLSVNSTTGLISGTPTTAGNSIVSVNATNSGGTGNAILSISIVEASVSAPVISSAASQNGQVGVAFSYQIAATNNPTSFGASGLPTGLSVNATTGLISGTPTTAGNSTVAVNATNSGGTGNATLTISITPAPGLAPVINSATTANATVGVLFTYTITASNNATAFSTSTLPSWLTLNATTGVLRGTPLDSGLTDITLTASNSAGTDTESLQITIAAESSVFQTIKFLGGASLPTGGEIVSYAAGKVATTNSGNGSQKVEIYTVSSAGSFTGSSDSSGAPVSASVDLSGVFDGAANISSISSVLIDARKFGVATVIPTAAGESNKGKIAFFSTENGTILKSLEVGYHPDSVTITPDGTKVLVTNEGEFVSTSAELTFARPGSISVIDISSLKTTADIANITQSKVSTYDFSSANLASGVSIAALRNPRLDTLTVKTPNAADIEPEYITATNSKAYVTLQENNGIAVFDLATSKYSAVYELGADEQLMDASDKDGVADAKKIAINDSVYGLPMPDTITNFTRAGIVYLATANEGDARPDDGDIARGSTLTANMTSAVALLATNTGIGRLNLLKFEGDTDKDGKIDMPIMMGTRSFSIWNSSNGDLLYDSASTLEMFAAANDPQTFNTNSGNLTNWDTRSDDKGPEPEAIAYASLGGRDYVFVGCERHNGIYAFDITDFSKVKVVGYFNTISNDQTKDSGRYISPESIVFVPAASNPSSKNLLVVGYEGTGSNGSVAVFEFAPIGSSSTVPTQTTMPSTTQPAAQKPLSSATTREEVKAIVSSRIQQALAQNPVQMKTASEIATILGVSTSTLSKIAKLAPGLKAKGGKINIAKLEKLIRNNPKAAALITGSSENAGRSKKASVKK